MTQPGFGWLMQQLGGNEDSVDAFTEAVGKEIDKITLDDNQLVISFVDSTKIALRDVAQSCCEHRYMSTEDDLGYYSGATLLDAEVENGPDEGSEWGEVKEVSFLRVKTSRGVFVINSYNEHNGYYGGICIRAEKR